MEYTIENNQLHVKLNDHDRYDTSIFEQLAAIKAKYPSYDTPHAERTVEGWLINAK